jgi:glycosyltransferase involved in cell wall biosynthesis
LLSIGVHWHRKGLATSVAIADRFAASGRPVHLDVVGATPPDASWARPYVTYHGFLNRVDPKDSARLEELYRSADVFLLPTRNEPFGIVFAEAAAFGLPAVGTRVGGVPDVVVDGQTGVLVDEHQPVSTWVDAVAQVLGDHCEYARMSHCAVLHYRANLTWSAAVEELIRVCHAAVRGGSDIV